MTHLGARTIPSVAMAESSNPCCWHARAWSETAKSVSWAADTSLSLLTWLLASVRCFCRNLGQQLLDSMRHHMDSEKDHRESESLKLDASVPCA